MSTASEATIVDVRSMAEKWDYLAHHSPCPRRAAKAEKFASRCRRMAELMAKEAETRPAG